MRQNTKARYGSVARSLHWLTALIILSNIALGLWAERIPLEQMALKVQVFSFHKTLGLAALDVALVRIGWALSQRERPPQQGPTAVLSSIGHKLLYLLMVAMPATGSAYVVGNGYGLKLFGVQLIERSGVETPWLIALGEWHPPLAWLTLLTVAGHVGAALLHHFVFKDDTLRRMA